MNLFCILSDMLNLTWFITIVIIFLLFILVFKLWIPLSNLDNSIFSYYQLNDTINKENIKTETKDYIKVMSYNMYLQSFIVCDNYSTNDCKNERYKSFIENYSDCFDLHDIICFQEVYATLSPFCKNIVKYAKTKGYNWYVVPEKPTFKSLKFMDSGLLIISKYPIIFCNSVMFDIGYSKDILAQKSFQYCIIDTLHRDYRKKYLHVINTHLQSEYKIEDDVAMSVKYEQLKQIRNYIRFYQLEKENLLICGDFNINCFCYDINNNYQILNEIYSKEYYKMLSILQLSIYNDVMFNINKMNHSKLNERNNRLNERIYERHPTLYCTYDTVTGKELDTRCKPEYTVSNNKRYDINKINIPRCVDYMFFSPYNSNIRAKNSQILKFPCNTSEKYLQQCSDHFGISSELIL